MICSHVHRKCSHWKYMIPVDDSCIIYDISGKSPGLSAAVNHAHHMRIRSIIVVFRNYRSKYILQLKISYYC